MIVWSKQTARVSNGHGRLSVEFAILKNILVSSCNGCCLTSFASGPQRDLCLVLNKALRRVNILLFSPIKPRLELMLLFIKYKVNVWFT